MSCRLGLVFASDTIYQRLGRTNRTWKPSPLAVWFLLPLRETAPGVAEATMAKRELSSTLRNLKFMQRATQREEKPKKEEEAKPDESFFPIRTVNSKCVVVIEGDPHPGAVKGRMSFQSFNPSIDKLNGKGADLHQPETSPTSTGNGKNSDRENDMSEDDGARSFNPAEANGNDHRHVKRKQTGVGSEAQYPNKSQNSADAYQQSSPNSSRVSTKQKKREKLDWNVLDRRSFKAKKRDPA